MFATFDKKELIEVDGKYVQKEYAFPNLDGNQNAIMLRKNEESEWEMSGWGGAIDANGTEACGWELLSVDTLENILAQAKILTEDIDKD